MPTLSDEPGSDPPETPLNIRAQRYAARLRENRETGDVETAYLVSTEDGEVKIVARLAAGSTFSEDDLEDGWYIERERPTLGDDDRKLLDLKPGVSS